MKKKKKQRKIYLVLTILVMICLVATIGIYAFLTWGNLYFFEGTTINSFDVSKKTPEEVVEILEENYNQKNIEILEEGEVVFTAALPEIGYRVNEQEMLANVEKCLDSQKDGILLNVFKEKVYTVDVSFTFDKETFEDAIQAEKFSGERTESQNAELIYNGETYEIQPEIYGNTIHDVSLRSFLQEAITETIAVSGVEQKLQVQLDKAVYEKPEILQNNAELVKLMNGYNKYCQAVIKYKFGSEKVKLNWKTIKDWVVFDGYEASIDTTKVQEYVQNLANEYDTIYRSRTITTSHGTAVTLSSNDYGYCINLSAEAEQLLADINSNTTVKREPVYVITGYQREGKDDVVGTYIEINLANQHLWFYKDYNLVIETDIVTGDPKYQETATGAFPLAYKASPFNLTGGGSDGVKSWDVEVQYWMPFYDGQGLHDASWRSSFGGNIYKGNGSHGCVNLPPAAAKVIYENVEAGMPIFLY